LYLPSIAFQLRTIRRSVDCVWIRWRIDAIPYWVPVKTSGDLWGFVAILSIEHGGLFDNLSDYQRVRTLRIPYDIIARTVLTIRHGVVAPSDIIT
jgi:hypothetical protein